MQFFKPPWTKDLKHEEKYTFILASSYILFFKQQTTSRKENLLQVPHGSADIVLSQFWFMVIQLQVRKYPLYDQINVLSEKYVSRKDAKQKKHLQY